MEPLRMDPPPPVPWDRRALLIGTALAIALYFAASLLGSLLVVSFGLAETPLIALALALGQLGMLLPPLVIIARRGNPFFLLGLDRFRPRMLAELVVALGLGFLGMMVWGIILFYFGQRAQEPIIPLFGEGLPALASAFLVGAIMAAVIEEVVFRGFLFGGLLKYVGPVWAAIGSAVLFGALHLQPLAFPALTFLGLILALLYYRTGSLWMPILMHFVVNALALLAQFVAAQQGLI
jgi:uncharacterized protein